MQETLAAIVAANVRAEMARRGMTAQELAQRIDRTPFYLGRRIGRQQRATIALDVDELERIAGVLGLPPEALLRRPADDTGPPQPRSAP